MTIRKARLLVLLLSSAAVSRADDLRNASALEDGPRDVVQRLARRIEPDLAGRPDRLRQYVEFFRSEIGNDFRLFAFDVEAVPNDSGKIELHGHIEFPETR